MINVDGVPSYRPTPKAGQVKGGEDLPDADKKHGDFMAAIKTRVQNLARDLGISGVSVNFAYTVVEGQKDKSPVASNVRVNISPSPSDPKALELKQKLLAFIREGSQNLPPDGRERNGGLVV